MFTTEDLITVTETMLVEGSDGLEKLFKVNTQWCYDSTVTMEVFCNCPGSTKKFLKHFVVIIDNITYNIRSDRAVVTRVTIACEDQDFNQKIQDKYQDPTQDYIAKVKEASGIDMAKNYEPQFRDTRPSGIQEQQNPGINSGEDTDV